MKHRWLQAWWTAPRLRNALLEALIAMCLAFLVWLYIHSRAQQTLEHVQIPIVVQLAAHQRDQYALEIPGNPRVTASFVGPASRIRELRQDLQQARIKVIMDYVVGGGRENDAAFSDSVRVDAAQLPAPPGVTAELDEESRLITFTVQRLVERTLPVKLDYTGDARVTQIKLEPSTVQVRGPKNLLDRAEMLATLPHAFTALPDDIADPFVKGQISMTTELEGRPVQVTPAQIAFRCKVAPRKKIYELHDVPVHLLCPTQFPWRPRFTDDRYSKTTLRLIGPTSDETPPVLAYVDLTKGTFGRGRNLEPLRLQLPKDFQLMDNTPALVVFELEEPDRAAATADPENR
jgi:hypothetical protein